MKHTHNLRQLGTTQRNLLRTLLASPQGATIEDLCKALRITQNAVRQHLAALMAQGFVRLGKTIPSGGRPRACYVLQPAGRELFPRNYALVACNIIEYLYAHAGAAAVQRMLTEIGTRLGTEAAARVASAADAEEATHLLAEQLDMLGYEAQTVRQGDHVEVEARSCVFDSLAKTHPEVCHFDLAFMGAATGRPVQRTQCVLQGCPVCRFRVCDESPEARGDTRPTYLPGALTAHQAIARQAQATPVSTSHAS